MQLSTLGALVRATHSGPTISVTLIAVVVGIAVDLSPFRLIVLGLVVLANQASIGLSNDWLDVNRDRAVGRLDKPVAAGEVRIETARASAIGTAIASIALAILLGPWATLANAAFIVSAWSYNLGLKSSPLSVVPYLVSFGILPLIVTLARPDEAVAVWWAIGAAALLGGAAHFANVLPDFDDDRVTGVRGLPHILGRAGSGIATCVALVGASALIVFGAGAGEWTSWVGFAATIVIAVWCAVLLLTGRPSRLLFRLIILAALINVALLALSGDSLLA